MAGGSSRCCFPFRARSGRTDGRRARADNSATTDASGAGGDDSEPGGSQPPSKSRREIRVEDYEADQSEFAGKVQKALRCDSRERKLKDLLERTLGWAGPALVDTADVVLRFTGEASTLLLDATSGTVPFVSIADALVTRLNNTAAKMRQVDDQAGAKMLRRVINWSGVIRRMPTNGYPGSKDNAYVKTVRAMVELELLAYKWNSMSSVERLSWGTADKFRNDLDNAIDELDAQYDALVGHAVVIALERIEDIRASTTVSRLCIHNLPGGLPELLGREAELDRMRAKLAEPGTITSFTGIAGVGKSQLAYRCAYSFAFDGLSTTEGPGRRGRLSWILDASSDVKLSASYTAALVELTGKKAETVDKDANRHSLPPHALANMLLTEIARSERSGLLVFDNVKDDEDDGGVKWLRQRYFSLQGSTASVRVLITSRSDAFRDEQDGFGHIYQVPVNELSKDDSIALLLGEERTGQADREAAASIYARLGGHALSLSVTRKYISSDEAKEKYGDRALQVQAKCLEQGERPASADAAVAAAVARPLEMVRQKHPRAWAILGVAAYVDPKDMPQALLLRAAEGCTAADLRVLLRLNLLQWGASGQAQMRSMHRLLQGAVRQKQGAQGALAAVWAEIALFEQSNVSTWAYARSLMPHVEAMRESALTGGAYDSIQLGFVNNEAGFICKHLLGDYDRALQAYEEALRVEREALGDDHPSVATTRSNIASVYSAQGRHAEALREHEEALRVRRKALGDDHPDVAQTRNNIGFVYWAQGRLVEALQVYEEALRVKREALGDDHPSVATTRNNIGGVYRAQGRHAEALQEYEEVLRVERAAVGDDHPDVAQTRNNIGTVYQDQGRHAEARREHEEALRVRREALGDDHPDVAQTRNNIGSVYQDQGRHAEALQEYEGALRVRQKALGDDHPDVATTLNNIGSVYRAQGRHAEALQVYEEALRVLREALGDDHPDVATARNNIGLVYRAQGRHAEALQELEEALRVQREALGDEHLDVATARNNIGLVYKAQGRLVEALQEYEGALRVKREALGDDHPDVAQTRNNIGSVYQDQGRHAEALQEYEEALRVQRKALGDDHPSVATTRNNIASVYSAQGRHAEALQAYEAALRVFRFVFGDDHPSVATTRNNIECVHRAQGRHG